MNSQVVRQTFLDFFRSRNHTVVPSAPMVIKDDPTLMFTNAGMNQFKELFLGNKEIRHSRIADTQKCLRVSGKHNDLEEVGHDTYHHTMFEMLGNWSFGDYFKKEAIEWGWELLTKVYKIDQERLYITVFGGDEAEGLKRDEEACDYWKKIVPEERILFGSKKDNFWEMGDTGPCGPCSEIHVDLRDEEVRHKISGRTLVNTGDPLVIEVWNLVFIEFNRQADGKLVSLPAKHIDTGMGFERLCMVMQGKKSNYDTDVFQPLISAIAQKAGIRYGADSKSDVAMRVISDHLRAISFAIADGQLPSNNKAGYVIRRILRRAVRYGYTFLDFKEPFIFGFVPVLTEQMGEVFPELKKQQDLVMNVIREEETAFLRTLSTGIQRFQNYIETLSESGKEKNLRKKEGKSVTGKSVIDGSFAFELYDTYGFPIDLTELMAKEIGWEVDRKGFDQGLTEQKTRSRNAAQTETSDWIITGEARTVFQFVGYDSLSAEAEILRYRKVQVKENMMYHIVLDKTPCYAESGGQVGDKGWLISGNEKIEIENTIREHDLVFHITKKIPSTLTGKVTVEVDAGKRLATANNHSATHLLHAALRKVLGTHVEQKGSLVDADHLRFDFTHFSKMSREEIEQVEQLVNQKIRANIPTTEHRMVPLDKAREMGAMALFGEKYGDTVRVIAFDPDYSIELCGGTHVHSTGQIGQFKIISEGAIAAGIRRIEAVTAVKAEHYFLDQTHLLEQVRELLKNPKDLLKGLSIMIEENHDLKKKISELEKTRLAGLKDHLIRSVESIDGINFLACRVDLSADSSKSLAFDLSKSLENYFLVLAGEYEGKANLTVVIAENLVKEKGFNAGLIVRELAKEIDGGGGGQAHIATAGGKNPAGIPIVIEKARGFLK